MLKLRIDVDKINDALYWWMNLKIGIDSFKDALYWWRNDEYKAFWVELNSGYYQLNPMEYHRVMLGLC